MYTCMIVHALPVEFSVYNDNNYACTLAHGQNS